MNIKFVTCQWSNADNVIGDLKIFFKALIFTNLLISVNEVIKIY